MGEAESSWRRSQSKAIYVVQAALRAGKGSRKVLREKWPHDELG